MIKRIICVVATVVLVLVLGARLDKWRDEGVSLVAETYAAISFGEVGK